MVFCFLDMIGNILCTCSALSFPTPCCQWMVCSYLTHCAISCICLPMLTVWDDFSLNIYLETYCSCFKIQCKYGGPSGMVEWGPWQMSPKKQQYPTHAQWSEIAISELWKSAKRMQWIICYIYIQGGLLNLGNDSRVCGALTCASRVQPRLIWSEALWRLTPRTTVQHNSTWQVTGKASILADYCCDADWGKQGAGGKRDREIQVGCGKLHPIPRNLRHGVQVQGRTHAWERRGLQLIMHTQQTMRHFTKRK